jgi:flagellar hook-associated protein 1 FlgK
MGFPSYPVTVTVNGTDTTYNAGPVHYTSGATYSFDGISFTINGDVRDGDTFTIERNVSGVSDNRNALLLAQMQTGKTMAGYTASFSTVYAQMVSDMGNKGAEVQTVLAAQETLLAEAQSARDSVSGVNTDEEAVNLILYQQQYQAAAKMLQIASELFDSILAIR